VPDEKAQPTHSVDRIGVGGELLKAGKPNAHVGKIQPLPNEKHRQSEGGHTEPNNRTITITYRTHRDTSPTTRSPKQKFRASKVMPIGAISL